MRKKNQCLGCKHSMKYMTKEIKELKDFTMEIKEIEMIITKIFSRNEKKQL